MLRNKASLKLHVESMCSINYRGLGICVNTQLENKDKKTIGKDTSRKANIQNISITQNFNWRVER